MLSAFTLAASITRCSAAIVVSSPQFAFSTTFSTSQLPPATRLAFFPEFPRFVLQQCPSSIRLTHVQLHSVYLLYLFSIFIGTIVSSIPTADTYVCTMYAQQFCIVVTANRRVSTIHHTRGFCQVTALCSRAP